MHSIVRPVRKNCLCTSIEISGYIRGCQIKCSVANPVLCLESIPEATLSSRPPRRHRQSQQANCDHIKVSIQLCEKLFAPIEIKRLVLNHRHLDRRAIDFLRRIGLQLNNHRRSHPGMRRRASVRYPHHDNDWLITYCSNICRTNRPSRVAMPNGRSSLPRQHLPIRSSHSIQVFQVRHLRPPTT